jgi:arabinan endo-1,5-alpha-L-arabinosidase
MKKQCRFLLLLCLLCDAGFSQQINAGSKTPGTVEIYYKKHGKIFHQTVNFPDEKKFALPIFSRAVAIQNRIIKSLYTEGFYNGKTDSLFYYGKQVIGWQAKSWTSIQYRGNLKAVIYFDDRDSLFYNFEYQQGFWSGEYPVPDGRNAVLNMLPLPAKPNYKPDTADWHVNDHCFIYNNGEWNMFGIISPNPGVKASGPFNYLGHGVSGSLTSTNWKTAPPPFYDSVTEGSVLWAPHVVKFNDIFYMFYCAGGKPEQFAIALRTSSDLKNWSEKRILFREGYQARDPMVLWLEDQKKWVIYYCSTEYNYGGHHVVAYKTTTDLSHWSEKKIAYKDIHTGTDYGNTESPFVVKHGKYYYLFTGPRPYDYPTAVLPNHLHPGYVGTDVYRSGDFNHFENAGFIVHLPLHAAEVIRDNDGKWYISSAGEIQGGLFITSLFWNDKE